MIPFPLPCPRSTAPKLLIAFAETKKGQSEARDFFEQLSKKDKATIIRIAERLATKGRVSNKEKFKQVEGKVWEFKSYQTRLFAVRTKRNGGDSWIITHGITKKRNKLPPGQPQKAIRIERQDAELEGENK